MSGWDYLGGWLGVYTKEVKVKVFKKIGGKAERVTGNDGQRGRRRKEGRGGGRKE